MVVEVVKQKKFGDFGDSEWAIEMRGGSSASETKEMTWFYTEVSTVLISTPFRLYHRRNDRIRDDILGSVSITTIFTSRSQIFWCYSQWQSAYLEMLSTIPQIQFVKAIPPALRDDSYFDVSKQNVIVLHDPMIDASKDKRILNIFTRGSHHRNLSIIYIVQNLFYQGKDSRSISLNSHYLILFKNSTFRNNKQTGFFNIKSVLTTPLNSLNVTPKLNHWPSILAKPTTLSSTPLVSNPSILTPHPTVETPSQGPKRKRRPTHFVNYLDDNDSQKQRKQTRRQRYRAELYKYSR